MASRRFRAYGGFVHLCRRGSRRRWHRPGAFQSDSGPARRRHCPRLRFRPLRPRRTTIKNIIRSNQLDPVARPRSAQASRPDARPSTPRLAPTSNPTGLTVGWKIPPFIADVSSTINDFTYAVGFGRRNISVAAFGALRQSWWLPVDHRRDLVTTDSCCRNISSRSSPASRTRRLCSIRKAIWLFSVK